MANLRVYEECNDFYVEIDFEGEFPSSETRNKMKENGFRWNPSEKVWWSYFSDSTYELANILCDSNSTNEGVIEKICLLLDEGDYIECTGCGTVHSLFDDCPKCECSEDEIIEKLNTGKYEFPEDCVVAIKNERREIERGLREFERLERIKERELRKIYPENWKSFGYRGGSCSPR